MHSNRDAIFDLCWKDQVVGTVTRVGGGDFPWMEGSLVLADPDPELRAVLEWISSQVRSDDDLEEPPFREELLENWSLRGKDGSLHGLILPCVDLVQGTIEFPISALPESGATRQGE